MMNKRCIKIMVLLMTVLFLSTAVYAKSSGSNSKKHSNIWWRLPYYHLCKTANDLKKKNIKLEKKVIELEAKLDSLQGSDNGTQSRPLVCPGCDFSDYNKMSLKTSSSAVEECTGIWVGYDFSEAYMDNIYFRNACINDANFKNALLRSTYFTKSNLKRADFSGADLTGSWFAGANLEGANFNDSILTNVVWYSTTYGDAICPDGQPATAHQGNNCMSELY